MLPGAVGAVWLLNVSLPRGMARVIVVTPGMSLRMFLRLRFVLPFFIVTSCEQAPWYERLACEVVQQFWISPLPVIALVSRIPSPHRRATRRVPRKPAMRLLSSFNALTLSPADARRGAALAYQPGKRNLLVPLLGLALRSVSFTSADCQADRVALLGPTLVNTLTGPKEGMDAVVGSLTP